MDTSPKSSIKEECQISQVRESSVRSHCIRDKKDLNKLSSQLEADAQINAHERGEKNKDLKSGVVRWGINITFWSFWGALAIWLILGLFQSCPCAMELSRRLWLFISNIFELFIGALIGKFIGL